MIDVDLVVYLGVLVLFIAGSAVVGTAMLLVLTAVALATSIRGRRKHPAPHPYPEHRRKQRAARWFSRRDS